LGRFYASDPTKPFGTARGTVAVLTGRAGIELMREVRDLESALWDAKIYARGQGRDDIVEVLGGMDARIVPTDADLKASMEQHYKDNPEDRPKGK
jgi:hypothetical protein